MKNTIHINVEETFDAVELTVMFEDCMVYGTEIQMREKGTEMRLADTGLLMEILVHRIYQALKPFEGENVTGSTKIAMNRCIDECLYGEWDA